jgi:hypothetical protein
MTPTLVIGDISETVIFILKRESSNRSHQTAIILPCHWVSVEFISGSGWSTFLYKGNMIACNYKIIARMAFLALWQAIWNLQFKNQSASVEISLNIGRYIETTITPTVTPKNIIIAGSSADIKAAMPTSTSSS